MYKVKDLRCPHLDDKKANELAVPYFCKLDNSYFYSMDAHCKLCSIYDKLCKRTYRILIERGII